MLFLSHYNFCYRPLQLVYVRDLSPLFLSLAQFLLHSRRVSLTLTSFASYVHHFSFLFSLNAGNFLFGSTLISLLNVLAINGTRRRPVAARVA